MSHGSNTYVPSATDILAPAGLRTSPLPDAPECAGEDCTRPPYDDEGFCKKCHDLRAYRRATRDEARDEG